MITRNILITNGMSNDMIIISTNAPKKAIEKWCKDTNINAENGINEYFDKLQNEYQVDILHDSEIENNNNNIDIISYSEVYDLNNY